MKVRDEIFRHDDAHPFAREELPGSLLEAEGLEGTRGWILTARVDHEPSGYVRRNAAVLEWRDHAWVRLALPTWRGTVVTNPCTGCKGSASDGTAGRTRTTWARGACPSPTRS